MLLICALVTEFNGLHMMRMLVFRLRNIYIYIYISQTILKANKEIHVEVNIDKNSDMNMHVAKPISATRSYNR
jgi:hypothetical protein